MTTEPGHYDFTIYQGATFSRILTWKDASTNLVNLTGYSARMHIRASQDADAPFITLTTDNGGIVLGGVLGTITLTITSSDTSALTDAFGVYDLELVAGNGTVTRLLQGHVVISKEVTR